MFRIKFFSLMLTTILISNCTYIIYEHGCKESIEIVEEQPKHIDVIHYPPVIIDPIQPIAEPPVIPGPIKRPTKPVTKPNEKDSFDKRDFDKRDTSHFKEHRNS